MAALRLRLPSQAFAILRAILQESARPVKPSPQIIAPAEFRPPGALTGVQWPRLPWGLLVALLTVLLTLGVMAYMALARSVSLSAEPAAAVVSVKGFFAPRIGKHWLLLPGTRHYAGGLATQNLGR